MTGQKPVSILVEEEIYEMWKSQEIKARLVFERGLKYPSLLDEISKLKTILETFNQQQTEINDKKDKALEHMKDYFESAEKQRDLALIENNKVREDNLKLKEQISKIAP